MHSPIQNYIESYEAYSAFKRNHIIGSVASLILGVALGAIAYYALSHGMIPHLPNLGMNGNIIAASVSGYSLSAIGIIVFLASYILRVEKKRDKISDEKLLNALTHTNKDAITGQLKHRWEKIGSKMSKNRLKQFLGYVDFHYFSRPELNQTKYRKKEEIEENSDDFESGLSGKVQIPQTNKECEIYVPFAVSREVMSNLAAAFKNDDLNKILTNESLNFSPQLQNYFDVSFDQFEYKTSEEIPTITSYFKDYESNIKNKNFHVLACNALPILTLLVICFIELYLGGILPHSSLAINIAYESVGTFVISTAGEIAIMLNYLRTNKEKHQRAQYDALVVSLSNPNSSKDIGELDPFPTLDPLFHENYPRVLSYIDQQLFSNQTIKVGDNVKGRIIETLLRYNAKKFEEVSHQPTISNKMETFIKEKMFAYIDRTYFKNKDEDNNGVESIHPSSLIGRLISLNPNLKFKEADYSLNFISFFEKIFSMASDTDE